MKSVRPATTTEEAIKQPASVSVVGDPTYHRSCTYTRVHHTHQREEITVCASYLSLTSLTRAHRAHTGTTALSQQHKQQSQQAKPPERVTCCVFESSPKLGNVSISPIMPTVMSFTPFPSSLPFHLSSYFKEICHHLGRES